MSGAICLSPEGQYLRREALADAAGILPGHLLIKTATGVAVNATADDVPVRALFANLSVGDAGDETRAYASGETVNLFQLQRVHTSKLFWRMVKLSPLAQSLLVTEMEL